MGRHGVAPGSGKTAGKTRGRPTYSPGVPKCPAWLSRGAKVVWRRTVAELEASKTLALIDVDVVAAYSSAVADLEAVSMALDNSGVVVSVPTVDRNGRPTGHTIQKPNPLLKAKSELLARVRQYAESLGIGPVSRTREPATPRSRRGASSSQRTSSVLVGDLVCVTASIKARAFR